MTGDRSLLTRTLRIGNTGKDVEAVRRTIYRYLRSGKLRDTQRKSASVRRTYGPFLAVDVIRARKKAGFDLRPIVGPTFLNYLVDKDAPDALAIQLFNEYRDEQDRPQPVKLIEPKQGFQSLDKSLWEIYSIGRRMGLSDLGTYNPASRLPSGGPSDHAVYPAFAFDLGIDPDNGYMNPVGRKFFDLCTTRPEVEYVILGTRIFSRYRGVHKYTGGGHANHVHVSGRR